MTNCKYCKKDLPVEHLENKIGHFCNEEHFNKYLESLSDEEYVELMNSFCICSDE